MLRYDEIRSFTPDELAQMQSEIARVQNVISQKESDLGGVKWNPLNWISETQRDAMTRMGNAIKQDKLVLDQLIATRDETVSSNDTDKLQRWFDLSGTVGDRADLTVWNQQKDFASTTQTVKETAKATAQDLAHPFGVDWKWWAGGLAALWIGSKILFRRKP